MSTPITDVRILGASLQKWRAFLRPTAQTKRQLATAGGILAIDWVYTVVCVYTIPAFVYDAPGVHVFSVFTLTMLGLWIMVAPIRRTPEEQRQYDAEIDADVEVMLRKLQEGPKR